MWVCQDDVLLGGNVGCTVRCHSPRRTCAAIRRYQRLVSGLASGGTLSPTDDVAANPVRLTVPCSPRSFPSHPHVTLE